MLRKIWIVAVVACACVALTPDSAEAGRRKKKGNDCCCQQTCCNTCNTGCNTCSTGCNSCSSCNSCGGGMVGGMVTTPTAPPPVATK